MTNKTVKDPVCGMEMKMEDAATKSNYKGKTYYFCEESCKTKFDKNPEKYAKTKGSTNCECC